MNGLAHRLPDNGGREETVLLYRLAAIAALLIAATFSVLAQTPSLSEVAGRYAILSSESRLDFRVRAVGGPGLSGRFGRFEGRLHIPSDSVEGARIVIQIFPESVTTGQERADWFLRSDAVFDAVNEPVITFQSTRIRRTGEDTAVLEGRLTARGRSFEETFNIRLAAASGNRLRFHVEGQVFRSRYGMDVGTPLYSNVVDFDMDLIVERR